MSIVDQIAAVTGLSEILMRKQAKQAGVVRDIASGDGQSSIAKAPGSSSETESDTTPDVHKSIALAGDVIEISSKALSSVTASLSKALATAKSAVNTPPWERDGLEKGFNLLLDEASTYVGEASVNGINLVGEQSRPLIVHTTVEGGKLTIPALPSSTGALGISKAGAGQWVNQSQINQSISQLQLALAHLSASQSKLTAAQSVLRTALQINEVDKLAGGESAVQLVGSDISPAAMNLKRSEAQADLAIVGADQRDVDHARSLVGIRKE